MILLQLFWSFFQIGLFSIGGGYAVLPMVEAQIVERNGWLSLEEFTDVLTISQMTPGPIGINAATFVGTKIAGVPGAVVATLGSVAPAFIIVLALAYIYTKYNSLNVIQGILGGLRPAVVGLIAASGLSIMILAFWNGVSPLENPAAVDFMAVGLFAAGLLALRLWKPNPIYIILGAGAVGLAAHFIAG